MPCIKFLNSSQFLSFNEVKDSPGGSLLWEMVDLALNFGVLGWSVDEGADGPAGEAGHHETKNA